MTIGEKLKSLRARNDLSVEKLVSLITDFYGTKEKISAGTIRNIESGSHKPRINTLKKIAFIYGLELLELVKDTDLYDWSDLIRYKEREAFFRHDDYTEFELTPRHTPYRLSEYVINGKVKTPIEQSPKKNYANTDGAELPIEYKKTIIVLSGRIKVYVADKIYYLSQKDSLTFDSTTLHYYENQLAVKAVFHVYLNPKHF